MGHERAICVRGKHDPTAQGVQRVGPRGGVPYLTLLLLQLLLRLYMVDLPGTRFKS